MRLALLLAAIALSVACVLRAAESPEVKQSDNQPPSHSRKLKVFILAGQSNMEGHAKVETFDYLGCAKTFALMGRAFAEANLRMMPYRKTVDRPPP